MIRKLLCTAALAAGLKAQVARLFTVDKTVKLETLDWGGTGRRPGVLLAASGTPRTSSTCAGTCPAICKVKSMRASAPGFEDGGE